MNDDLRAVLVRVTGHVQGVGFRAWTRSQIDGLDLSGWARNEADGSVTVAAKGPSVRVASLLERLRTGPSPASVTSVTVEDADNSAFPEQP